MANVIKGINTRIRPQVVVNQRIRQSATNVNGGTRLPLVIGEGLTEELLVSSAQGGGLDGVNSDYSGTDSPDGRHFQFSQLGLVENRTEVLKNGIPLTVLEEPIDSDPFDARYDARVDPETGRLELQRSYLRDFGGDSGETQFYRIVTGRVGNGELVIDEDSLVDTNAPAETWTVRCTSVILDAFNIPIPGEARFSVTGSVSGAIKDANGAVIVWKSNGVVVSNDILSFAISEGTAPFRVGDRFVIEVRSGVLQKGDELEARYIPSTFLNDPELFLSPTDLFAKHGTASATNTLSLGAMMAFENGAPAVIAVQAKPAVPRRTSETVLVADNPLSVATEGATGDTEIPDTIFPLSVGAVPDTDTTILIFVVDPDGTEEQLVLDKEDFYNSSWNTLSAAYSGFVAGPFTNSYTVISAPQVEQDGVDGYIYSLGGNTYFTSETVSFSINNVDAGESDLDKQLVVFDNSGNMSVYNLVEIGDGYGDQTLAQISLASGVGASGTDLRWEFIDPADTGSYVCLTDDVVSAFLTSGKGLRVSYIDTDDADFFDTNWSAAYEAAETVDAQYIVPLPTQTISNVFAAGKAHVIEMSNLINAKERMLVIGAINGLTPNNLLGVSDAAVEDLGVLEGIQGDDAAEVLGGDVEDLANYSVEAAYGDTNRAIYMGPDQIVRNIAGTNTTLSGYFLAAPMAGFIAGQSYIAEPATNKTLTGFTIPRDRNYRPLVVNSLLDAGVCLVEPVQGGGRVIHGLTTAASGAGEDEEISIMGVRDAVVRALRTSLRPFIGRVNSPTAIAEISGAVDKLMRAFISVQLLTGYSDLSVSRNSVEPRQIDIAMRAFVVSPINWISVDIEFSI
jgi:hypothetical protein